MAKEVKRTETNGYKITKTISYKLQFTDSARFMADALSNLVDNCAEKIYKINYKYGHETCRIKYNYCACCLEYINVKDNLIECKSLCRNNNYQKGLTKP